MYVFGYLVIAFLDLSQGTKCKAESQKEKRLKDRTMTHKGRLDTVEWGRKVLSNAPRRQTEEAKVDQGSLLDLVDDKAQI